MKRLTLLSLMMILVLAIAACGSTETAAPDVEEPMAEESVEESTEEPMEEPVEEEMASNTIVDIAVNDGRFETLVTAVTAAGLAETLSGEGNFTVFAPTDDAFAALPEGTVEALLEDPQGALTNVLLYHVVDGKVMASDVVGLNAATTLSGEDIAISASNAGVFLNENVQVIITDIEADNGVIHVVDTVLLPPSMMAEEEMPSIAEIAAEAGTFNTLLAALNAAGLAETFASEGSFTVFAPTDDAFAALPEGTVEALLEDPQGALTDILTYHVIDGKVMASDVSGLDAAPTLNGKNISFMVDGDTVILNENVMVTTADIEASNGVIHVIDAVLLPPDEMAEGEIVDDMMAEKPSIAEIAINDGNFDTLVAALDAAGLVETLSNEGKFTVFAPTDEAFAALPEGTIDALLADPQGDLTNILLYHVVDGVSMAEDVVSTDMITTLQGDNVSVTIDGENVLLNDTVMVMTTDIQASNGVIHVIDAVLIPAS
jgi:transforming growth factor-beta-induced protein